MNIFTEEVILARSIQRLHSSEIRKVFDLIQTVKNPINLSIGQPDFSIPKPVKEAIIKAIQENKTAYTLTKGIPELREALATKYTKDLKHPYSFDNIIVSTGTANILHQIFCSIFNPNDELLLIDPYFIIYQAFANYHQLKVHYLSENFTLKDLEKIKPNIKNLKAILFATPSNPTGKILTKEQIETLVQLAKEKNSIIISDEIYQAYDYENKFVSAAQLYPEGSIIINGFSKSHAMTGMRIGYCIVSDTLSFIIDNMSKLQQYSAVCAPQPSQWGALMALQTPITEQLKLMNNRRKLVIEKLSNHIDYTYPEGAFYCFIKVPLQDKEFIQKAIKKRLLVVPGYIFSHKSNYIRISYAQKSEILEEGLEIILELVKENS